MFEIHGCIWISKPQRYVLIQGSDMMDIVKKEESRILWFAMRATYRRELVAKRLLDESMIENYIPMQQKMMTVAGKKKKVLVPAVHNLIFVHTSQETIQAFKKQVPYLQYMMDKSRGEKSSPIIVPDKEMENFMRVVQTCQNDLEYLPVGDKDFPEGARVRINGGQLDGVEGVLARTGKSKDKKLVVKLNGIILVATTSISPDSVEILGKD